MCANPVRQPIVALSWILEMPHDLGLPQDARTEILRPGGLHGWDGHDLDCLPRWDGPSKQGHPVVALRFRRAQVGIGMPTEATDRCFGDMQTEALTAAQRRRYERGLKKLADRGAREWKTVVRITQWYEAIVLPSGDELDPWLGREFRTGLSVLNSWLSTYALASGSLRHGPVSLADLPAIIPTVMEGKDEPDNDVNYGHRLLPIHDAVPALVAAKGDIGAAESASRSLLMGREENPFIESLQLLFGAQVHLASGRERQAVLDSGTAIEVLVSSLLRSVGANRESFKAHAALRAPFRNRFEDHLPVALGDGSAAAPDFHGARSAWWTQGYKLRNDVVHEGREADPEAAVKAVECAWDLVESLGSLLRESDDTEELGSLLRVEWHTHE